MNPRPPLSCGLASITTRSSSALTFCAKEPCLRTSQQATGYSVLCSPVRSWTHEGINNGEVSQAFRKYNALSLCLVVRLVIMRPSPWAKVGLARRKVVYYKRLVCSELSDFFSDFFCVKSLFEMSLPFLEETCGV